MLSIVYAENLSSVSHLSSFNTYKNDVFFLDSIKELEDTNRINAKVIFVKNYQIANDGGGGFFVYDENKKKINNGGTIINGWVRQYTGNSINVQWFGARTDGSNAANAIQKAIDSGAKEIFVPSGRYRLDGKRMERILSLRSHLHLRGGVNTIFDFSHNIIGAHHSVTESYIAGQGDVYGAYTINKIVYAGDTSIYIKKTGNLKSGDLVMVYSDDTVDIHQPVQRGELLYVKDVDVNHLITFNKPLSDTYRQNPKIRKINPLKNITIENIKIIGSGRGKVRTRGDIGIVIQYGENIDIKNCSFQYVDYMAIDLESVIGFHIEDNRFIFSKKGTNPSVQYGIKYSNASRDGYINTNHIYGGKHGIVQGHTMTIPGVTRDVIISGNTVTGTWHAGIVVHESAESITIMGNHVTGCFRGIESRIPHMIITNNHIKNISKQGILVKDTAYDIVIADNIIRKTGSFGIYVYNLRNSQGVISIHNNNIINAYGGIVISHENNTSLGSTTIEGNILKNLRTHGITLFGNLRVNLIDNTIEHTIQNALYVQGNHHAIISHNSIYQAKVGLYLDNKQYSVNNLIVHNNIFSKTKVNIHNNITGEDLRVYDNVLQKQ